MNRWASGVVSAAKSNLVGMDIRQPRARGTTPLHIQCHYPWKKQNMAAHCRQTSTTTAAALSGAPGHGHHMCQNTISDQASD